MHLAQRERASQPLRSAHPEEPLAFVSISSGKKEQRRGGRTGDAQAQR